MVPNFCSANRSAASAVSSNTKLVLWTIGTARAPDVGSGRPPAWMARVRNPHCRSAVPTRESYCRGDLTGCAWHNPLGPRDLDFVEGLDEIAGLEVLEVGQTDTAFEALADFT